MSIHVIEEANRCLQCKNPRCRQGCPINTNIPEMIRLLKENKIMEAAYMLFENNPLSVVCSQVCNHEKQCEGHCVRGIKGEPVHISAIENYISDSCFNRIKIEQKPYNGMKAAVIGAGPAGITIAIILASRGYKITMFDVRDKIGGILRYGIPEFRLSNSVIDRYDEKLHELGVYFRPNFAIGQSTSIQDLFRDGYKAVFVGTGAWRPKKMNIPGETFGFVHYAINYLNNPNSVHLGEKVAIIGAGNSAMDVARSAIRQGAKEVTVYVRGTTIAASKEEFEYALLDGAVFEYNKGVVEIVDDGIITVDVEEKENGEIVEIEGTRQMVPADNVIIAISQIPQKQLTDRDERLKLNEKGTLQVNEEGETTVKGVFASGDVVTGAKTVVDAVAVSKKIADDMDHYMQGLAKEEKTEKENAGQSIEKE